MSQIHTDAELASRINRISEVIIGCAFRVGNALGGGFLEKVYENALAHELRKAGLRVDQQVRLAVWYDGVQVGDYVADVLVENLLLVEIKAARAIDDAFRAQCIHYLAATRLPVCLLLNFSRRVEVKRFVGPGFAHLSHLCTSVTSVASSASAPMTWAEKAEWDEP